MWVRRGPTSANRWSYLSCKRLRWNVFALHKNSSCCVEGLMLLRKVWACKVWTIWGVLPTVTWDKDRDAYSSREPGWCAKQFNKHGTDDSRLSHQTNWISILWEYSPEICISTNHLPHPMTLRYSQDHLRYTRWIKSKCFINIKSRLNLLSATH